MICITYEITTDSKYCIKGITDVLTKGTSAKLNSHIPERFGLKIHTLRNLGCNRYVFKLFIPEINISSNIASLLTYIAGEIVELKGIRGLKIVDIELDPSYLRHFKGPVWGMQKIRRYLHVYDRPLVGAIIKPAVGISVSQTLKLVKEFVEGGVDFIKDDELLADMEYNKFSIRAKKILSLLAKYKDGGWRIPLYGINITTRVEKLKDYYNLVYEHGGNCVMLNAISSGFGTLEYLREFSKLPIFVHKAFSGNFTRPRKWGMTEDVLAKLERITGADFIIAGGVGGKLYQSKKIVKQVMEVSLSPISSIKQSVPVLGGGQDFRHVHFTYKVLKNVDFLHLSGGGIVSYPKGPCEAIRRIIKAWGKVVGGGNN